MSSHPYEYKILVEYISPQEKGRYPHFSHIEDQKNFTKTLEEVFLNLPKFIDEGWEVNSHNITVSRNTLVITILLRRSTAD